MRLVCPNCEAKYEVPDDAIPDNGRDVQCANCGHAWFQMRARSGAALSVAEVLAVVASAAADAPEKAATPVAPPPPPAEPEPEPAAEPTPEVVTAGHPVEAAAAEMAAPDEPAPATQEPDLAPADEPLAAEADLDPEAEAEPELAPEPMPMPEADPVPATMMAPDPEPVAEIAAVPDASDPAEDPATDDGAAPAGASTYAVDDSVLAILREEAEREANARRADALESQTDLGLDSAMPVKAAALAVDADSKPSARRDLLPDVEEINSTLRPSEMQAEDATDFMASPPVAPRGFRSGFLAVMTIAILGAALYIVAPRLGAMVPSLSGPLDSYVSVIDSLRLGLDGVMRSATVAINGG